MKKQLLIAAVAATMTSVAIADISITGGSKVNYANTDFDSASVNSTNAFAMDTDFTIVGKNGGTTVSATFATVGQSSTAVVTSTTTATSTTSGTTTSTTASTASTSTGNAGGLKTENVYVTSSIGDVNVKVGTWMTGDDFVSASNRKDGKFLASTTLGGVKVTYENGNDQTEQVSLAGSFGGVNASYLSQIGGEEIKVSTTVQGISIAYHADNSDTADSDLSSIEVTGTMSGVTAKYAQATADKEVSIQGDTWMGDFESAAGAYILDKDQDVTSVSLATTVAGNTVEYRNTKVDGVADLDMSFNQFIVTRPLASGATFEATYTDLDDSDAALDSATLDLELAVKF